MVGALLAIALFAGAPADSTPFDRFAFRYERPPAEMIDTIEVLCHDDALRERIGAQGRATILARHTCMHRTQQLLGIVDEVRG